MGRDGPEYYQVQGVDLAVVQAGSVGGLQEVLCRLRLDVCFAVAGHCLLDLSPEDRSVEPRGCWGSLSRLCLDRNVDVGLVHGVLRISGIHLVVRWGVVDASQLSA